MAFATANVQKNYFGSLRVVVGDWTGSVGDSPGSLTVEGGRVYLAQFTDQDGGTPAEIDIQISTTQSGSTSTITVYNKGSVTTGRFLVISK